MAEDDTLLKSKGASWGGFFGGARRYPGAMDRLSTVRIASLLRALAAVIAVAGGCAVAVPALADEHGRGGQEGRGHEEHHDRDHDRGFRRGPSVGVFLGGPGYISPPPVYYAPGYGGYAPIPVTGVYLSPYGYGYCRDYQTMAGIETACQGADGVWRFIN